MAAQPDDAAPDSTVVDQVTAGPDVMRRTCAEAGPVAEAIAHRLRERRTRRVFVIGNGTSLWSSRWICEWYRYRAAPDDPILVPMSAAAFRHSPDRPGWVSRYAAQGLHQVAGAR